MILAGEIFGFNGYTGTPLIIDKEILQSIQNTNIKKYEELVKRNLNNLNKYGSGINSADNNIRIFPSDDGKTLMAEYTETDENGNQEIREVKANLSIEYKLRSSYKIPYETFLAHSVGADTLFIPSFNPNNNMEVISITNNIAQQLDELSIVWKSSQGQSKAWEIINSSGQNSLEFGKYMGENISKPYSNNQLYLYTILTHFDLQNIIIPLYKADPIQFPIKEMCEYNKKYKELMKQLMITNDYVEKTRIEQQLDMLRKSLKYDLVTNNYQKFLNGDSLFGEEYTREILSARNQILNLMNNPNITLKEIQEQIFGSNPLFKRISVLNGANFHSFDSSIYQQRQQVASSRWWLGTRLN